MREQIRIDEPATAGAVLASALDTLASADLRADAASTAPLLALLAAGRFDIVSRVLAPPRGATTAAAAPGAADPADGVLLGLLLCRYSAWSGELHAVASRWAAIREAILAAPADSPSDDLGFVIAAGAAVALERTAADLGDPAAAAAVHGRVRALRARAAARAAARTIDPLAAELAVAVGLLDDWPAPFDVTASPLRAAEPTGVPLLDEARTVLRAAHAMLGLEPDAPRHRLRLRPRLGGADRLVVHDIGFGDALISMNAVRSGGDLTIRVRQDSGGIPVTVLLEPFVDGTLAGAAVDGRPAALLPKTVGGGVIVPVQIVLDADRTLVLRLEPAAP